MHYPRHFRKPLTEFSSRSTGNGLDPGSNTTVPTAKQGADNSNTRLVIALVGLSLLFCIYLYFFFRPIIKDKNCVAPYDSTRNRNGTDLEKGTTQQKSDVGDEKALMADLAAHLEKRKLHQWLHRASRGRFLLNSKVERHPHNKGRKMKKRMRYDQNRSEMPTICVSPPPPVYGSNSIKADPIFYLSDSYNNYQEYNIVPEENTLLQRPTHALLVPMKAACPEPNHHSLVQPSISNNGKDMDGTPATYTRNNLGLSGSGRLRTILPRSLSM
ncbi:hypothetical protein AGABI1DRAFT_132327 [Agaricus bisporus var. burnettii JB137-S8]|uniref:Uncharacterized protein n=2 Tax=Agaricus bisporus var. burnettii TaxID=192524 RepID=K5WWX1_AGABU|nr:uncharacterized protein AGABI1DRAFT_132327 [Agaricus bisporus var. burnettii JB137-S8]EKM75308.1 hypothetical protein AGABI1DRAFT_132327 [Agaricus bisporus var. burnettii JB137-S8]KAF7764067.1 hypothetical protein Agabi119p4_8604 [Agaricus bisporus var. burnettii]